MNEPTPLPTRTANGAYTAQQSALLATLVEFSDDAIITKTLDGIVTSWNAAAERMFGYTAEEMVGGPISTIIPPERGAEEIDILRRISQGERLSHFETVRLHKDGRRIDISATISPLVENGRIVGASKIARDISQALEAQREIELQRAELEVTLRSIGDAVIRTDVKGLVTFMNPVAESLTGWSFAEARGLPLEAVFHIINEVTRRRTENPVVRAVTEGTIVGLANHTLLVSKAGTEYAIADSAAPIRTHSGEIAGVVLVFRDESAGRAAEDFRARLAAIVQTSDDAIISKDLTGRITSWNAGATRLFGYSLEEVLGRPISMLIPPDRLDEEPTILARLRQGERVQHFETVRLTKDRRKVAVSLTISPIRDTEGKVIGASKIARDITQQKKAERDLAEAKQRLENHTRELEKTVLERTADLRAALEQLETFSISISHDLRAPLRAINGMAEVILKEHVGDLTKPVTEMVGRIRSSGLRLHDLIDQVLRSARAPLRDTGRQNLSLSQIVPMVIQDYPNVRAHSHCIEIREPLDTVRADESLLTQALSNLLGNAVKFASRYRPLAIVVSTERKGDRVRLVVQDNGVGIAPEEQPGIFDLFARAAVTKEVEGLGIGLAIARNAALRMGGDIGVESTPGEGSTFWIELPAARER